MYNKCKGDNMKRVAVIMISLALGIFSVPVLNAQTETGNTGTQNTQTDSTQGTTGSSMGTDQSGSSTGNTQGTTSQGTDNTGTGTDNTGNNTGTTGTNSGVDNTGTTGTGMGTNNTGTSGTNTESGNTGMSTSGSGMSAYGMNSNSGTAAVQDLSRLDEKPTQDVLNEFKPVAEERANELVSKLGLEQDKADKIRESIMDYFNNYWESRVSLDKDNNDASDVKEHNADLANQRVDLIEDIEDELTDAQINQFQSFKVDWWKSLDIALFDVQQNAATSSLARDNNKEGSDEQQ